MITTYLHIFFVRDRHRPTRQAAGGLTGASGSVASSASLQAVPKGHMNLFTRLMGAGADESGGWRGYIGRTLLGVAACVKREKMVLTLLGARARDDVNVGVKREPALHLAVAQDAEAIVVVNALMLAGTDPNVRDGRNQTPLHLAAHMGRHEIARILLRNGADPDARTCSGLAALHLAAKEGHAACVSELLLGGAEKDPRSHADRTPLQMAAAYNRLGAAEQLLAAGANPDIRSFDGWSVLDIAASRGNVSVLRALLRHGDVHASDNAGNTALHYAASFEGSGDNGGSGVRVLLEAGAHIEAKTDVGYSPLHTAANCELPSRGVICALLEGEANVNVLDESKQTPLHIACLKSKVHTVELLLQWGADEMLTNEDSQTPGELVGQWNDDDDDDDDGSGDDEHKVNEQRVRHMLARAPADRSWRRRGWLVLCRSHPNKVQLARENNNSRGGSLKMETVSSDSLAGNGDNLGDETSNLANLVDRVVGLEADGVFRLAVGFL